MLKYLAIYRPLNIFFIALAQFLCAYFLDLRGTFGALFEGGLQWILLGTAACSAFGYWVNDWLDKKRDAINKQEPSAIVKIPLFIVILHLIILVGLGLWSGYMLGDFFLNLFLVTLIILSLYSLYIKNVAFLGNLVIAILSFVSVFMISFLFPEVEKLLLFHFALLALVITLGREMLKDGEDALGDEQTGAKTIPILFGLNTLNIAIYILLIFSISFITISLYYQGETYFQGMLKYLYFGYYALFVIYPLYAIAIKARYAETKSEYAELSKWLKYVLFVGVLSVLFF
jgi:4-hydroxybenzoate polyprenyltransferase